MLVGPVRVVRGLISLGNGGVVMTIYPLTT